MQPFTKQSGLIATLDRANVDTDQIIPKQFLKSIVRTGFGEALFHGWRFKPDGSADPDFELNASRFRGASLLVTRHNFGCGSSREHAVWALLQYGFKAVIAPNKEAKPPFADIFKNNSMKNGLLTVELTEAEVEEIFQMVARYEGLTATVDLTEERVVLHLPEEIAFHFSIDPAVKDHLARGEDEIAKTLSMEEAIKAFEAGATAPPPPQTAIR